MSVQLLRNTRVFVSLVNSGFTAENTQEILVQDDITFSQDSNSTDITLNEAGPRPTRGSDRFNDSLNPADWSFSTYLLPYADDDGKIVVPDLLMWHCLCQGGALNLDGAVGTFNNETNLMVNFKDNAYHELAKLNIFLKVDQVWKKISDVQVGQAEVNVDIDDIGLVTWSGNGTTLRDLDAEPVGLLALGIDDALYAKIQSSYIKNKLTILKMKDAENSKEYNIAITGGSFTINNNITYLTPNTLSRVDIPIGSFSGSFDLTGSLTAYLNTDAAGSAELYKDLLAGLKTKNRFEIAIILGGEYVDERPAVVLVTKRAQVNIPSIETDDVLGTTVEFKAIPSEFNAGDEGYIGMSPIYTKDTIANLLANGDGAVSTPIPIATITLNKSTSTLSGVGTFEQLTATIAPTNATNTGLDWTSNAPLVASVDTTGKVIQVGESGTATITATAKDGGGATASCVYTVSV